MGATENSSSREAAIGEEGKDGDAGGSGIEGSARELEREGEAHSCRKTGGVGPEEEAGFGLVKEARESTVGGIRGTSET